MNLKHQNASILMFFDTFNPKNYLFSPYTRFKMFLLRALITNLMG